jgi:SSS family solute:Na+ symporter
LISLLTRQKKTDEELGGLVYSLTSKIKERDARWWQRPALLGSIVLALAVVLNLLFW